MDSEDIIEEFYYKIDCKQTDDFLLNITRSYFKKLLPNSYKLISFKKLYKKSKHKLIQELRSLNILSEGVPALVSDTQLLDDYSDELLFGLEIDVDYLLFHLKKPFFDKYEMFDDFSGIVLSLTREKCYTFPNKEPLSPKYNLILDFYKMKFLLHLYFNSVYPSIIFNISSIIVEYCIYTDVKEIEDIISVIKG